MSGLYNLPKEVLMEQLQGGLMLVALGMGTVFVFLTLLLFVTKLMSKVCLKIAPAKASAAKAPVQSRTNTAPSAAAKDAEIAAAIATAYKKHNN